MLKRLLLASSLMLAVTPTLAEHHQHQAAQLHAAHAWTRAMPSTAKTAAVYLHLHNKGSADDVLESAHTPIADRVEVHTVERQNDLMKMVHLNTLPIAANTHVELAPGGMHLMLFDLNAPLTAGSTFALHLTFAKAGTLEVEVSVSDQAPSTPEHSHQH